MYKTYFKEDVERISKKAYFLGLNNATLENLQDFLEKEL